MKTLFVLLIIASVAAVINLLIKKYAFVNLIYDREINKNRCFKNESISLTVHITNKKMLPLSYIEVVEKIPADLEYEIMDNTQNIGEYNYHHNTMMLLPYQRVSRRYNIVGRRRGRYSFSDVIINAGDLLGLETSSNEYKSQVELIVYPSVKPFENIIVDCRNPMGDVSVKRWIIDDPSVINGIREYTAADPQSRIHWASSAKYNQLMVKNYDFTADHSAMILLNIETSKPFWVSIFGERIETAIETAASAANYLLESGMACGIFTNAALSGTFAKEGNCLPPSCSPGYLSEILQLLARITYSTYSPFEAILMEVLQSHKDNVKYVIITPIITAEISNLINILSTKTSVMLITSENQDISMIYRGVAIYTMREDGVNSEAV